MALAKTERTTFFWVILYSSFLLAFNIDGLYKHKYISSKLTNKHVKIFTTFTSYSNLVNNALSKQTLVNKSTYIHPDDALKCFF